MNLREHPSGTAQPKRVSQSFVVSKRFLVSCGLAVLFTAAHIVTADAQSSPSLVMEVRSGQVLHAQDATHPWYPASLTKMMTMYVALQAVRQGRLRMDTPLVYSARASKERPSKMGFRVGSRVTLDDAIKMLMVKSANDIAVTIAEGVDGSVEAFVANMNATARQLGMLESNFTNPNGWWDPQMVSTARDMALLGRSLLLDFPEYNHLLSIPAIQLNKTVMRNSNNLIGRYPGAGGIKTGYTCPSGFNLVAMARRGDTQLIAVVLGSPSNKERGDLTAELLERGFEGRAGAMAGQVVTALPAVGGIAPNLRETLCTAAAREARAAQRAAQNGEEGLDEAATIMTRSATRSLLGPRPQNITPVQVFVEVPPAEPKLQQGQKRNSRTEAPALNPPIEAGVVEPVSMPSIIAEPRDVPPPPPRRQKPRPVHDPMEIRRGTP